jgi:hypothetical protein
MNRRGIWLAACAVLLVLAAPASAKEYAVVQDASGQYYVIDVTNPFWSKIRHPLLWLRTNTIARKPPGFGGTMRQSDMNSSLGSYQAAQSLVHDARRTVSRVPGLNTVTAPAGRFLGWGNTRRPQQVIMSPSSTSGNQ